MEIKIILKDGAVMPTRQTKGSAGYDLSAFIELPIMIGVNKKISFCTGVSIEIPDGYVGFVTPRSGLSTKNSLIMLPNVGTIDSDYRGFIKMTLHNLSNTPFILSPNDRVAQLVVVKAETLTFLQVDKLSETERGVGGFGSTGA